MNQKIQVTNTVIDEKGEVSNVPTGNVALDKTVVPHGGSVSGTGISITWQAGALGRGADRVAPNGAFVEGVINAAISRLEFYQSSKFKCRENALAITKLEEAKLWLQKRTWDREEREVEGTHAV